MPIKNLTRETVVAQDVRWATNPWTRFVGLMGRKAMGEGEALVFPGEKGVHTHFMRFPIDIVFYDRNWVVLRVLHSLRPWRFSPYVWGAAGVIELPAGSAAASGTATGDRLNAG